MRRVALFACAVAAAVAVGTLVPRPLFPSPSSPAADRRILLLANTIHTDIAFPADPDVVSAFSFLKAGGLPVDSPGAYWIVVGWGAREWYIQTPVWADARPGPLLKALTLDNAVMHVGLAGYIGPTEEGVTAIGTDTQSLHAMLAQALDTFSRRPDGSVEIVPGAGYGRYDRFYEAKGKFNALVGCNIWTAGVLRVGGLRSGLWNPLPLSLLASLHLYNDPRYFPKGGAG